MGKIMFLWGTSDIGQDGKRGGGGSNGDDPSNAKQWALGGDTWVLGCQIPSNDSVAFPQFNKLNPDMSNPKYNTKYGIYSPNCGLNKLKFTWGHDEYMYRMLIANQPNDSCTLPQEGLDMIRYHSAYPLHDKNAYEHLLLKDGSDHERLEWIRLFNKYDLYTKDDNNSNVINVEQQLWPYYKQLLNKYGLGGVLKW